VLFIDWEAQFSCTIAHCEKLRALYADVIETFYWVALPLTTQNALTQYKPQWQCWEPGTDWVRQPPPWAITHPGYFSFYQPGMSFEPSSATSPSGFRSGVPPPCWWAFAPTSR
jgi:predicted phosphoadenosine phosphosulfate sulfurtransferase